MVFAVYWRENTLESHMTKNVLGALLVMSILLPGYALAAGGGTSGGRDDIISGGIHGGERGGGSSIWEPSMRRVRTPEELAESRYNSGLKRRDKAWRYEAKAAEATSEKKRGKLERKAQKQYGKAIKNFRGAVEKNPILYQAHSSLGYALRRTGQYEAALEAYDEALLLQPAYAEAIEYRAEAYLGLNRLDEVKAAYMQLFSLDRVHADELMQAMQTFVQQERTPDELAPEALAEFAAWVQERHELAQQTAILSEADASRW